MKMETLCLTACLALLATASPAQTGSVFLSDRSLDSLGYQSGILFWKAGCESFNAGSRSIIERTPAGSSDAVKTYFHPANCDGFSVRSTTVAMDDARNVYWATEDGKIVMLRVDATPLDTPVVLADMAASDALPVQISVAPNFVYWSETSGEFGSGSLYRVPIGGGARQTVFSSGDRVAALHALGRGSGFPISLGESILYKRALGGQLVRLTETSVLPGQNPWPATTLVDQIDTFKVRGRRVYYTETGAGVPRIIRSRNTTGTASVTTHVTLSEVGSPVVADIAVDGNAVYWWETRAGGGPIWRKRLSGGSPEAITANLPSSGANDRIFLESDGRALYWRASFTEIRTLPVDAGAIEYDFTAEGIEVVQAIQGPDNDVPLVADKTTWVRAFGTFSEVGANVARLDNLSLVQLHGDREGAPLPGSPLYPTIHNGLTGSVDREQDNSGSWFKLPLEWSKGNVTLRVEYNGEQLFFEPNRSDNSASFDAAFIERLPILLHVYPLRTQRGTISKYKPWFQPVFDLAETLLPTPEVRVNFRGRAIEEWEPRLSNPFNFGPYEISKSDPDQGWVLFKLIQRAIYHGTTPGTSTHHTAFFSPFSDQALNGLGTVPPSFGPKPRALISWMQAVTLTNNPSTPAGGVTLAHEIAHNLGRKHVDCGDPDDPGFYPYDPCTIAGDIAYQGWSPISRDLIIGSDTQDLMTYGDRRWVSDFTWKAMFNRLDPSVFDPPAGGRSPRDLGQPVLLGAVIAASGVAELHPAIPLPDSSSRLAAAEYIADSSDQTTWTFVLRRDNGTVLTTVPAGANAVGQGGGEIVLAIMDEIAGAATLELQRTDIPNVAQATLTGGGAPPTLTITSPAAGDEIGGALFVRWDSSDPEGIPLVFKVRYSNDAGATWQMIADEVRESLLVLDATILPGGASNQSQIEVMASDGLRTTTAKSEFFTVPTKAPEPLIFTETDRGRSCGETPLIAAGEAVFLRGSASDLEDGNVVPGNLVWTVTGSTGFTGSGTGRELLLRDLPPGAYSIQLAATDSDNQTGTATASFGVRPFAISEAPSSIVVDGYGDDAAYLASRHPIHLRYPSATTGTIRAVKSGSTVYVSMTGLSIGADPVDYASLSFDSDNSDDANAQPDDIRFVATRDGEFYSVRGDGLGGFNSSRSTTGFTARVVSGSERWQAEFAIPLSTLGATTDQIIGMDVAHHSLASAGDDYHWFSTAIPSGNSPSAWADVLLGSDLDDPADIDGDGIYDAWELVNFGSTTIDGSQDADGDGQLDGEEFQSGTDPNSENSRFLADVTFSEAQMLELVWMSVADHVYTVEMSTDLNEWQAIEFDLQGTGAEMSSVVDPSLSGQRIYLRVKAHVCPQF